MADHLSMDSNEIRKRFLAFFRRRGHIIVPSAPLVPEGDPSVLFTTAGMQQFKPYYTGEKDARQDFDSQNTVSIQRCVRTSDIEDVGDETHLTFFEMLGNFSFGGYWKKEAIEYAHEFITKELELTIDYVSIFEGDRETPADEESREIWRGVDGGLKIQNHNRADNFWGPTGDEGPCGPTTEIYVNGVEIWNVVFNEFYKTKEGQYRPLETKGIDTGMGLERLAQAVQRAPTIFETDLFSRLMSALPENLTVAQKRILADHTRAVSFIINAGVRPANKGTGYILRRLLRKILVQAGTEQIKRGVDWMAAQYPGELDPRLIWPVIEEEQKQFSASLDLGIGELKKLSALDAETAFRLYNSYGLPFEVMKDKFPNLDAAEFGEQFKKHQEISRAGAGQKFKGGLADHSEQVVRYHTATHLLHQALHDVLGDGVAQKGSNITSERLRFDFSHPQKMTDEEKKKVEEIVNRKIREDLPVRNVILPRAAAERTGARRFFGDLPAGKAGKYGDQISIYFIGDSLDSAYSKEFCGGPHVSRTGELGVFKITKEEAVAAGVRRIKAVLDKSETA